MGQQLFSETAASARRSREPSVRGIRILVVDDDRDAREVLQDILAYQGAEVIIAASAAEGRAAIARQRPEIILSDISMPEEDGLAFIAGVRRLEGGHIPAVAISASTSYRDRLRALDAGFEAFIAKPYELAELKLVIAHLVPALRVCGL